MPITPLHFGVLAPVNHLAPGRVSNISFVLVNAWVDLPAIMWWATGYGGPVHGAEHSFLGVLPLVLYVGVLGLLSLKWWLGAALGGLSHVVLDALVHSDMSPFYPLTGNPLYADLMGPLSGALLVLCVWLTLQYVSSILAKIAWLLEEPLHATEAPSAAGTATVHAE
jgi:hypothetical protein